MLCFVKYLEMAVNDNIVMQSSLLLDVGIPNVRMYVDILFYITKKRMA